MITAAVQPALADDEQAATELYKSGMAEMAAKRYATACPTLRKSFRMDARVETLFQLAQCETAAGHVTSAAAAYDDYLVMYERLPPSAQADEKERMREAVKRRELLERDIPKVTFKLPGNVPEGLRVTRRLKDGGDPVDVALGVPLPIDPGEHFVATQAPDRPTWEKRFFVHKGEQLTVELEFAPPDPTKAIRFSKPIAPVPNILPPLEPRISGRRVAAYVLGGVGIAGLLTSAVTGAVTWGQKGVIEDNCKVATPRICNQEGQSASDTAKTLGTVSTVTIVAGGVLLAAGVILYVTEPSPIKLGQAAPGRFSFGFNAGPTGAAAVTTWTW
ncbi:Hypothetical protein A7982_05563 [Minicystis rosea]|nr:Hypothetical protein A7982_05563 [Minicystis rosea]